MQMLLRFLHGRNSILPAIFSCCLLLYCSTIQAAQESKSNCRESGPIVFGILPFISIEQLVYQFSPLTNYLSERLQVPVRIETAPDFTEFARRTHEESRYDILFTAPHFYTQAHRKAGYRLVARIDSPEMWAIIVVPKQSGIHAMDDLRGKRLATVSPLGLATLLVRKHLTDSGIDPDVDLSLIITPTHDASLLSSYHGVTDASALMLPPFETASERVRENMRIVTRTESTPHIPISLGPWVNENCAAEISALLLNMGATPEGQAVLRNNSFSGFRQANPEVYERLDELMFR